MLKIVAGDVSEDRAVLHLEGQVVGPWVAELERVCQPITSRELHLDLSRVSFVGREGVELLARLHGGRTRFLNCSRFVAEQLKSAEGRVDGIRPGEDHP